MPWHSGAKKQLAVSGSRFCRAVSIVAFFNKIVAYQELFCLVTLLASSIKHADDFGGNEKINKKSNRLNKRNKNSERTAHYLAAFFGAIAQLTVSNLIVATLIHVGEVNTFTESLQYGKIIAFNNIHSKYFSFCYSLKSLSQFFITSWHCPNLEDA